MSVNLTFTTLGELIKGKRVGLGISLSELGRMTGISKGVLSKIESGDTKRPELKTIKPLVDILKLPYEKVVELYVEIGQRFDVLCDLIEEAIELKNVKLVSIIVIKLLESPHEDTHKSLDKLYALTNSITYTEMKLAILTPIIAYAREHGIPLYIAKGLFQKYLIEREDLKRLEESFKVGEEIVHYINFLPNEERITFYYRMSLHAHNIKKYKECIQIGERGIEENYPHCKLKEKVALAICNSYIHLKEYKTAEICVNKFSKSGYQFVQERSKTIQANIYLKRGEYELAIPLLRECLFESTDDNYIHRLNDLLEGLFMIGEVREIANVLNSVEEKKIDIGVKTPYRYHEMGRFYKLCGECQVRLNNFDLGISNLLESVLNYEKVSAYTEINQCIGIILNIVNKNYEKLEKGILGKLVYIYNEINQTNKIRS
ncbi:helix-turn-helix domain-containing protein [Brevibacillus laterosporus]|uniref:helix-turn-helix domain-containing protein n=1 Tax=Brevibacillus laterosporus TaxID=1465 RepID=UPI000EAE5806|nr:helix-turn-helix transcriptional regulator [Brevibacillus laterosporus]AYK08604.1 XRE family transcriptional regulator [Brevibacillus laterosporus]